MKGRTQVLLQAFLVLLLLVSMEATSVLGDDNKGGKGGNGGGKDDKGGVQGDNGKGKGIGNGDKGEGSDQGGHKGEGGKGKDIGNGKEKGDKGNGNNGKGNGNNNKGNNKGKDDKSHKGKGSDAAATQYKVLEPKEGTGQERALCEAKGQCLNQTLECPPECPFRKPKKNKKVKACYLDCSSKCETTCKFRKPKCEGYGSICYDPRFVGGDGIMFYFHGAKGGDFALVSDDQLQINAHFIGTRPSGRTRDFTWVQALSIIFDSHTLVLAAKKVSHWNDNNDSLIVRWDGNAVEVPVEGEAEWRGGGAGEREVVVERTDETNSVRVSVSGLVEVDVKVTPIGAEENRVHNYQLPSDDAFAHLETQFRFHKLTDMVEGVLGKTYRPNYVSPVKIGVPMPIMGGEDKYRTPSLLSPRCGACRFQGVASSASATTATKGLAQY